MSKLNIDKFKKDDGYYDEDNCYYEDAGEWYQTKEFGFCGCCTPEENLDYIKRGLEHINEERPDYTDNQKGWSDWFKDWVDRGIKIFGNEQSRYFFFYWCDKEGLTDHGGCIPGWLTVKGKSVLSDLEKITNES